MSNLVMYLLVAVLVIFNVDGQRTPTISYISQEQIKNIGDTVELECSVQYVEKYPVMWVKQDADPQSLTITLNANVIVPDSRFSLRYTESSPTYTLQIKDLQETDAGIYSCMVVWSLKSRVSAEVPVQIRLPPIISDNSTRSVIVSEGESVSLECYAYGYPPPKISWRRENNVILPTGSAIYSGNVIKINNVKKEDRGTYYCVAENAVQPGARRNINLEVEFAPILLTPKPLVGQALQYDMDLECHVIAYPPPAITWIKDNVQLTNNQHYKISQFSTADEFTDSTLRVITIEPRQFGIYKCQAANKLGHGEVELRLVETDHSICPPACDHNRYSSALLLQLSAFLISFCSLISFLVTYLISLKCYQCNSYFDHSCGQINNISSTLLTDCSTKAKFCRKHHFYIHSQKYDRVIRGCGKLPQKTQKDDMCVQIDSDFVTETICECYEDGCNNAIGILQNYITIAIFLFIIIIVN